MRAGVQLAEYLRRRELLERFRVFMQNFQQLRQIVPIRQGLSVNKTACPERRVRGYAQPVRCFARQRRREGIMLAVKEREAAMPVRERLKGELIVRVQA